MKQILTIFLLLVSNCFAALGDINIRDAIFIAPANRLKVIENYQNNPEANKAFVNVEAEADGFLNKKPRPLEVLHYEGVLRSDPGRQTTEEHLKDMDYLAAVCLAYYGKQKPEYENFIKTFVWAWGTTYKPTGNPINENKLEAVFCGYYIIKGSFSQTEQETLEAWMISIVNKENRNTSTNNWETKRFKIIGEIGLAINRSDFVDIAVARYKNYIPNAIYKDGSTDDFIERDALSYHIGGLNPLLNFCVIAEQNNIKVDGKNLYEWEGSNGGSVKKSVHFLDPYIKGTQTHIEFENTKVNFDRQRCADGQLKFCPHTWIPGESAGSVYDLSSAFEPTLTQMSAFLLKSNDTEFPTWLSVLVKSKI